MEDVNSFERAWERYRKLCEEGQTRAAIEALGQIEQVAEERKSWPDLAAALWIRHSLEYGLTHKDDFFRELLVGSLAERMETFPAEVRPVLRLVLVHDGLTMQYPRQWWKKIPKRPLFADEPPPWSAGRIVSTLAAQFDIIEDERDFLLTQMVENWSRLLSVGDSFTRVCCPTLWDFAVYDVIDFVGRMKRDDEILRSKALGWLDGLLAVHPLDTEPDAHLHALYRKLLLEGGGKLAFAEKWFATSAVSADAAHAVAADLAASEKGEDRVRAHAIAERFSAKWPDSPGGCDCLRLMKSLEQPSLALRIENQLRAHGETISVTARNLTRLSFRLVPLPVDRIPAIRREMDDRGWNRPQKADDELPILATEEAVAEWSVPLDEWHDYIDHNVECAIPDDIPLGYYVLFAATNDKFGADGLPSWCRLVSRTDLHLVCRRGPTDLSGYVSDAETGRPSAGVVVEFEEGSDRAIGFAENARSAADGSWTIKLPMNMESGSVRARAVVPVNTEDWGWPLRTLKKCGLASVCSTAEQGTMDGWVNARRSGSPVVRTVRLHLVTDREEYRPGETVRFKGYAYYVDHQTQGYAAVANRRVSVKFQAEESVLLGDRLKLKTNEFGTFCGEFAVSDDGPTGRYMIEVSLDSGKCDLGACEDCSVKVERSKAPIFSSVPKGQLGISASAGVDVSKDKDSGSAIPWKLELKSPCETWRTASAPTVWQLTLRTIDNRPVVGVEAEVKVYALQPPERLLRKSLREDLWLHEENGTPMLDLADPRNWEVDASVATMVTTTSERGEAGGSVTLGVGVYRLEGTVKTESGRTVRASEFVRVIDPYAQTYSTREAAFSCVEKTTVKVGDTARLFFGTGYASAFCHVRVIRGDEVLVDEMREGTNWVFDFPVTE
ncbi:MAG: MG2 domain-containing protein, partial [Kiritimatiellae bacterium]|nr:MG2 domain-containing protein [Kiritimatiellia bacterium]